MKEQQHYDFALMTAESMYMLWELEYQQNGCSLDAMMHRLKDLSAYSLSHAEILDQREGVEMLAIAMFFGMTSDTRFHQNQARLNQLSEETIVYQGSSANIEQEIAQRNSKKSPRKESTPNKPLQPRLL